MRGNVNKQYMFVHVIEASVNITNSFDVKYDFIWGEIPFLWNVFLFWVIWFTYSSDKMSTLDTIVKDYDMNIVLRDCQMQAFEYLHQKLSHDRSLHDHVFWDYFWDAYRDREPARTNNSVWEITFSRAHSHFQQ